MERENNSAFSRIEQPSNRKRLFAVWGCNSGRYVVPGEYVGYVVVEEGKMDNKKKEEHVYKNRVVFLRLSKSGEHVYAFNRDGALGKEVSSLIANVKDIRAVIDGKGDWAKVSVVEEKEDARS